MASERAWGTSAASAATRQSSIVERCIVAERKEREQAEKKEKEDKENEDKDSSADEEEKRETPKQQRMSNRRLLLKLNGELLNLQAEVRGLVAVNPQLLPEVSISDKSGIFALAAELVHQSRRAVSTAWQEDVSANGSSPRELNQSAWAMATEDALRLVRIAASWDKIASPPFVARVLRAAALLDAELLAKLLRDELLDYCLALAPTASTASNAAGHLKEISTRFAEAIGALCRHA